MTPIDRHTKFRLSGKELNYGAVDFWEWYASNSLDGSMRGSLAEFIIMQALCIRQNRQSWDAFDLNYNGYQIEVKSTSLFTSKHGREIRNTVGNQRLTFSIEPKHVHIVGGDWTTRKRNSDLYIFALLSSPDAYLLDAWDFHIVKTSTLDQLYPEQKTISLSVMQEPNFVHCGFNELSDCVNKVIYGDSVMENKKDTVTVHGEKEKSELQRLIALYQRANDEDRRNVMAQLQKYENEPNRILEA